MAKCKQCGKELYVKGDYCSYCLNSKQEDIKDNIKTGGIFAVIGTAIVFFVKTYGKDVVKIASKIFIKGA